MCIGALVPNLLRVCSLSQPGGVCKAEWCPFVCVLSKSVCGEEYRGKVYALLVSTPGASHVRHFLEWFLWHMYIHMHW